MLVPSPCPAVVFESKNSTVPPAVRASEAKVIAEVWPEAAWVVLKVSPPELRLSAPRVSL